MAAGFLTLFAAKLALGGIADRSTLAAFSYLAGTRDVTYRTKGYTTGSGSSWSQSIQQRPVIPPERINTMPPGVGLLAHTTNPPHYITLTPPLPPPPAPTPVGDLARHLQRAWRKTQDTCRSWLASGKDHR